MLNQAVNLPDHSSAGADKSIPEIFSTKLKVIFLESTCMQYITNTDYEGSLANQGDVVQIRTTPRIFSRAYTQGQSLTYDFPASEAENFPITKARYFAFAIDNVSEFQSDLSLMDNYANMASEQIAIDIETDFFADIFSDAAAENQGGTAGKISGDINLGTKLAPINLNPLAKRSSSPYDFLNPKAGTDVMTRLGTCLGEQNVPYLNKSWCVMTPISAQDFKLSDLSNADFSGDSTSIARTGLLGKVDGTSVYVSNLIPKQPIVGATQVEHLLMLYGTNHAISFISNIAKTEFLPQFESQFASGFRMLSVYDYKAIHPEAMALARVTHS